MLFFVYALVTGLISATLMSLAFLKDESSNTYKNDTEVLVAYLVFIFVLSLASAWVLWPFVLTAYLIVKQAKQNTKDKNNECI